MGIECPGTPDHLVWISRARPAIDIQLRQKFRNIFRPIRAFIHWLRHRRIIISLSTTKYYHRSTRAHVICRSTQLIRFPASNCWFNRVTTTCTRNAHIRKNTPKVSLPMKGNWIGLRRTKQSKGETQRTLYPDFLVIVIWQGGSLQSDRFCF